MVGGGVVLVQAAVLAAIALPVPHSGGDNMAYLSLAHALVEGVGYVELWDPEVPPHTKYPPVFPAILALIALLGGTGWTAFKAGSAVALSAATLAAFAWVARRHGPVAGGAVALALVFAAGWQDTSRWILSEPWFLLWTFVALWAADAAIEKGRTIPLAAPVAAAAALLAFGVRTAGLPLLLALLIALLLARRRAAAAGVGAAAAVVVGGWLMRARGGGEGAYGDEFWLRSPYDPELGRIGIPELAGRVWDNLGIYLFRVLPMEWWSHLSGALPERAPAVLGVVIVVLAAAGWALRVREGPGPAELFGPLYAGLILVWPEVWSGDRFLLPLLPLILVWAGGAIARVLRWAAAGTEGRPAEAPSPRLVQGVLAAALLLLVLPAVPRTLEEAAAARECRIVVQAHSDALACYGPGIREFATAAGWMGVNLPDGSFSFSRKPRILYALGGPRGRTFPFTRDPGHLLSEADRIGVRYLLLDHWDGVAGAYLIPILRERPGAFCHVRGWGGGEGRPGTDLFGILPAAERRDDLSIEEMPPCPAGWRVPEEREPEGWGVDVPVFRRTVGGMAGR
jgi:hypothetical protein